jgi:hypothetical protein
MAEGLGRAGHSREGEMSEKGKSASTIARRLRELRRDVIENESSDIFERRIAYEIESAVTWATSRTVGWPSLAAMARLGARLLRIEVQK